MEYSQGVNVLWLQILLTECSPEQACPLSWEMSTEGNLTPIPWLKLTTHFFCLTLSLPPGLLTGLCQ